LAGETDDADLLAPSQVKHMVDEILASFRFNDEYTASVYDTEEIRRNNPIDRQIHQLIYGAKRLRAQLVENDISEVVDQMHELSAELNIPIIRDLKDENKRESPNKLLSSLNLWNALHGEPRSL
jgi:hypothetical protein